MRSNKDVMSVTRPPASLGLYNFNRARPRKRYGNWQEWLFIDFSILVTKYASDDVNRFNAVWNRPSVQLCMMWVCQVFRASTLWVQSPSLIAHVLIENKSTNSLTEVYTVRYSRRIIDQSEKRGFSSLSMQSTTGMKWKANMKGFRSYDPPMPPYTVSVTSPGVNTSGCAETLLAWLCGGSIRLVKNVPLSHPAIPVKTYCPYSMSHLNQ